VRPIPILLRRSLFDILGRRIEGCRFLDAFAGSGIVGIEALSRGAGHVDFVESDRRAIDVLRRNLEKLGASALSGCHMKTFDGFLRDVARPYDFAFLDPPYDLGDPSAWILKAFSCGFVAAGGLAVLKAPAGWTWAHESPRLVRTKIQGQNGLFFFA